VELELEDVRQEIARVRCVAGHVILGAGVEGIRGALTGRCHALVLLAQGPPEVVVTIRPHFAGKYFPAPLVDHQAERQERDLLKRLLHQQAQVA